MHGTPPHVDILVKFAETLSHQALHLGPCSFLGCTISYFEENDQVAMAQAAIRYNQKFRIWMQLRQCGHSRNVQPTKMIHATHFAGCGSGIVAGVRDLLLKFQSVSFPSIFDGYTTFNTLVHHRVIEDSDSGSSDHEDDDESSSSEASIPRDFLGVPTRHVSPSCMQSADACITLQRGQTKSDEQRRLLAEWDP